MIWFETFRFESQSQSVSDISDISDMRTENHFFQNMSIKRKSNLNKSKTEIQNHRNSIDSKNPLEKLS